MEQHANTLLAVYNEDLNRLRNRIGRDRSENTFKAMKMGRDYVATTTQDEGDLSGWVVGYSNPDPPPLPKTWGRQGVCLDGISDDGKTHFEDHAGDWRDQAHHNALRQA